MSLTLRLALVIASLFATLVGGGARVSVSGLVEPSVGEGLPRRLLREAASPRAVTRRSAWRRLAEADESLEPWRADLEPLVKRCGREAVERLREDPALGELAALGETWENLKSARREALDLILDEERYFYPFTFPHVSAERAREFPEVRRAVEERVEAVRSLWSPTVDVPRATREAIEEWCHVRAVGARLTLEDFGSGELPEWTAEVLSVEGPLGFANFAWTPEQREALRYDRAIDAFNAARWGAQVEVARDAAELGEFAFSIERDQVGLTNDYRRMLGLPALAWSGHLQLVAREHSERMATLETLGHDVGPEGLRTPEERMRAVGYRRGIAENLYFGPGGALAAHSQWIRSSGHHRSLLDPGLREMASAEVRGYWTQLLGRDGRFREYPEFQRALWHD